MKLVCLNAATGAEIWSHDLVAQFGAAVIPWQNAASPLVAGDYVYVNANGRAGEHLIAFRKADGVVAWKAGTLGMTHASPVHTTIAGVNQVIFLGQTALVSAAAESGAILWEYPLRYNGTSVAASPVVAGDTVYLSRAYPGSLTAARAGAVVLQVTQANSSFHVSTKWAKVNQQMNHWATPVYHQGFYYGMYGQGVLTLRCIDAETGETRWETGGFGSGSVTKVQNGLLVLGARGDLALINANPNQY
jgi:outer membrane protein assembly factor BamB